MSAGAKAVADSLDTFAARAGNVGAVAVVVAELMQGQRDTCPMTVRCVYAIRDLAESLRADIDSLADGLAGSR